jgi:hypothetical protein
MSDGVDPTVKPMQPASLHAASHRTFRHPDRLELSE